MSKIFEETKLDRLEEVDKNLIKGLFRRRNTKKQWEIDQTKGASPTMQTQNNQSQGNFKGKLANLLKRTEVQKHFIEDPGINYTLQQSDSDRGITCLLP